MESFNLFEQNAQDPLANFNEVFPELANQHREASKKKTKRHGGRQEPPTPPKKPLQNGASYVYSNESRRGLRLIRIEVVDLENGVVQSDNESEKVLYMAQYVVTDNFNTIMEQTEQLITNISKKICDNNFNCMYLLS